MRFISFRRAGADHIGIQQGDDVVDLSAATGCTDLGAALRKLGADGLRRAAAAATQRHALREIDAYRPAVADPQRIFCVGLNYEEHRVEAGRNRTAHPTIFLRLPSSQVGHMAPIVVPAEAANGLDFEGEIALVIGKSGRRTAEHDAARHIFGFSAYNDASARDWQSHSTQWTAGKNFPDTGAFGPALVDTEDVAADAVLTLETRLNGVTMQHADTSMMIFPMPELVAYVSRFCELLPGDVIVTGTPGGVGFKRTPPVLMHAGDIVEVEVGGVGLLRNPVAQED